MNLLKSILKNFGQILSVFTFILLCFGYYSLTMAYENYGIAIFHFIGVSEIIILSLNYSFGIFVSLLPQIVIVFAIIFQMQESFAKGENKITAFWRNTYFVFIIMVIYFIMVLVAIILIGESIPTGMRIMNFYMHLVLAFINLLVVNVLFHKKDFEDNLLTLGKICLILLTEALLITSFIPPEKERFKGKYLINNSFSISTGDTVKFIGNTSNFYFFYNNKRKTTAIYPASSISKIEYEDVKAD